ncbi:MAG: acyltransferase [Nevskia sp.]|nr:acyltransferase [Nevskia sp.]
MNHSLSALDRSWLLMDSADTPMHIGSLLIFSAPDDARPHFVAQLAERLRAETDVLAPWNLKLVRGMRRRLSPGWEIAADFDLEYHLRRSALPAPGGERELGMLVSRLHSHALDLSRPPWECHLIEGLHGGRYALYFKVHHALMDVGDVLRGLTGALSKNPRQRGLPPLWALPSEQSQRTVAGGQLGESLRGLFGGAAAGSQRAMRQAMQRLLQAARKPGDDLPAPYTAPRSALNVRIGPQRRFATQQFELARLQRAATAAQASVDEIVLYLCASVLRRFFKEYNALPQRSLVAAMPGLHADGDAAVGDNVYGAISLYSLGTHLADPLKRLAAIRCSVRATRAHLDALPPTLLPAYALTIAAPLLLGRLSGIHALVPRMFNLVISDLAGPRQPLYLDGSRLEAIYPMFPLTQDGALSIACYRYADTVNFGLAGARDALPHLQRMAVYMEQALQDLEDVIAGAAHE